MSDPRVRGSRVGQLLASGSYWVPARMDLDTMLSKIDSRSIDRITVIPGPYTALYGPGFDFVDVDLLGAPRYENGRETHGVRWSNTRPTASSCTRARAASWGTPTGVPASTTGSEPGTITPPETRISSCRPSYRSGDLNAVIGWDPSDESRLEFSLSATGSVRCRVPRLHLRHQSPGDQRLRGDVHAGGPGRV